MNPTLIMGAVALAGLLMAMMQGRGVQADDPFGDAPPEIIRDAPVGPPPEITTEPLPPAPPGGQYELVAVGDLSIEMIGG